MKYMDWAAMGAASGAYGEASRAQAGVNQLWNEIQLIREDINNQKYEQQFQKWAEELIYQFSKTVKIINDAPAEPLNDCADLASFLSIIEDNNLNTAVISGFEHKERFEKTLLKAQNILTKLEKTPQVQDFLRQQEEARLEQERLQEVEAAKATAKAASAAQRRNLIIWLMVGLSGVLFILSMLNLTFYGQK